MTNYLDNFRMNITCEGVEPRSSGADFLRKNERERRAKGRFVIAMSP